MPRRPGGPPPSCREAALALLALRTHARRELERKLGRRGFGKGEIATTLDGLAEIGLVDDGAAAEALVRSEAARGRGRRRVAASLAARGVDPEAAARALAGLDPAEERAALEEALRKRAGRLPPGLTGPERSKKLFAHLVRRGFAPGAVLEALRKEGESADEDEG